MPSNDPRVRKGSIRYGGIDATCDVHDGEGTRFGTLVDPNGHCWLICADCINTLWGERSRPALYEADQKKQEEYIDAAMGRLREMLLGGELWNTTG